MTKEIIDIEQQREDQASRCVIHLFKEGTFLRAYNWSAWLCCRYLHDFKVNKRKIKGFDDPVVYIGFPETSLDKWLPQNCEPVIDSDKHYILNLLLDNSDSAEDVMKQRYSEWYNGIPIAEQQKKDKNQISAGEVMLPATMSSVIQRIASFPVESKSPIDCMLFIAELKQQISQFI